MAVTELSKDEKKALCDSWQAIVDARGRLNVITLQLEQLDMQIFERQGFVDNAKDENALIGSKVELARLQAERDSLEVETKVLGIQLEQYKVALAEADLGDLPKEVKDGMTKDAE